MPRFDASLRPEPAPRSRLARFQGRLALLGMIACVGGAALAAQLSRLTVVRGDALRAEAEARLYRERWSPTIRGRILDRQGRQLARDRASYDLAIDYAVLDGSWAREQAWAMARRRHADAWSVLRPTERERLRDAELPAFQRHVDQQLARLEALARLPAGTLAARRGAVVSRVEALSEHVARVREQQRLAELAAAGRELTPELAERIRADARVRVREQASAHTLAPDIADETAFDLMRAADATIRMGEDDDALELPMFPGLLVRRSADRLYPLDEQVITLDRSAYPLPIRTDRALTLDVRGVAAHVIGWTRNRSYDTDADARRAHLDADPDRLARATVVLRSGATRDRGAYQPDDVVGAWGAEAAHEHTLRGLRGFEIRRIDTAERSALEPEPGADIRLTIDAVLQARVQAVLDPRAGLTVVQPWHNNPDTPEGEALHGAAVVLDIDTAEVLALVTSPEPDRDRLVRDWSSVADDPAQPLVNRAVSVPYAPGSIAKALTLAGAASLGLHDPAERIPCTGHLLPDRPDLYRCWIYRPHFGFATHSDTLTHDPDGRESLMVSCNIYYYTMGRRLGPQRLAEIYRAFGLGQRFGFGAGPEHPGRVGRTGDGSDLATSDAIFMAMGQGPVDWTPMHAANAYATLARLGVYRPPVLALSAARPEPLETAISLDPRAVRAALDGLDAVINDPVNGTAHAIRFDERRDPIFNADAVRVLGKTGTATARVLVPDPTEPGRERVEPRDHAWMVCLAGPEGGRPRFAIAVLIEQGGGGGRVAGPVANQIIHALRAEGYL